MRSASLRPATAEDAEVVARIWYDGWRDGHLGNVPEALAAIRTPESFRSRAVRHIDNTVVAVVDADVAGFAMVHGDEVEQMYVAADHRGTGVAALLLSEAEQRVAAAGHPRAWLAVVAGNAPARQFYERCGWSDEGLFVHAAPVEGGTLSVPAHRYVKTVG
jgi:GNAT superfamily N-acetyltransferase